MRGNHNFITRIPKCTNYANVDHSNRCSRTCLRVQRKEYCRSVFPPYYKVIKLP